MIRSKHSEIHQQKGRSVGFTVLKNINCVHKRALLKERLEELTYLKLGGNSRSIIEMLKKILRIQQGN